VQAPGDVSGTAGERARAPSRIRLPHELHALPAEVRLLLPRAAAAA